ncbi:external alternative NAD(P)H-ubiquinone oxidoreductase B1, mitochondrial, partial [Olea europaea subsp. europaea]
EDISKIFKAVDKDNSGTLTIEEFQDVIEDVIIRYPQVELYLKSKHLFDVIDLLRDIDGNDRLEVDIEGFKLALSHVDTQMKSLPATAQEDISKIFKAVDKDNSGTLTIEEFQDVIEDVIIRYPQVELYLKSKHLFDVIDLLRDIDGNDRLEVDIEGFKLALSHVDTQMKSLPATAQVVGGVAMVSDLSIGEAVVLCECRRRLADRDGVAADCGVDAQIMAVMAQIVVLIFFLGCWMRCRQWRHVVVEIGDIGGAGSGVCGGNLRKWVDAIRGGFCWLRWQRWWWC